MFKILSAKDMVRREYMRSLQAEIDLEQQNRELGVEISEREINEVVQGLQLSDLEIQLLELQLGGIKSD